MIVQTRSCRRMVSGSGSSAVGSLHRSHIPGIINRRTIVPVIRIRGSRAMSTREDAIHSWLIAIQSGGAVDSVDAVRTQTLAVRTWV